MSSVANSQSANGRSESKESTRDEKLDLVRGLSAILVLLGHIRALIFHDLAELRVASIFVKAGYFITGLGHQAVMVFFVLSGYFVGGSILQAVRHGRFTWLRYASARLTRLWVVLLPALVLTAALDHLGMRLYSETYTGQYHDLFRAGPSKEQPLKLDPGTFFGNLAFLQTITVTSYGTNGPLWSLANEFWYYVLFPLAVVSCGSSLVPVKRSVNVFSSIAVLVLLCCWLPMNILLPGVVWLLGVFVWQLTQFDRLMRIVKNWRWNLCFGLLFLGTLIASKTRSVFGSDYAVGIAFALWMPSLLGPWSRPGWCRQISIGSSDISYTLYVTHFPLLFLLAAAMLHGRQLEPDVEGCGYFLLLTATSIAAACGMWYLFESNTPKVRRTLMFR